MAAKKLDFTIHTEYTQQDWSFSNKIEKGKKIIDILRESKWTGSLKSLKRMRIWYIS